MALSDQQQMGGADSKSQGNNETKSVIYAPFNTTLQSEECASFADHLVSLTVSLPGEIHFSTKVRELNRQYEFNHNGEIDNCQLI